MCVRCMDRGVGGLIEDGYARHSRESRKYLVRVSLEDPTFIGNIRSRRLGQAVRRPIEEYMR